MKTVDIEDRDEFLEKEFNFNSAIKNPYVKKLHKKITMNVDADALDYFRKLSTASGIPYQTLINLYLVDCANCVLRSLAVVGAASSGRSAVGERSTGVLYRSAVVYKLLAFL